MRSFQTHKHRLPRHRLNGNKNMRKEFYSLWFSLGVFSLIGCIFCHAAPNGASTADMKKISELPSKTMDSYRLTIPSADSTSQAISIVGSQGTPILVHVTLKNISSKSLNFGDRGVGKFQFKITKQSGQVVSLSPYGKKLFSPTWPSSPFRLDSDSFVLDQLPPGKDCSWDEDVSRLYFMDALGIYRITLVKSNLMTDRYTPSDVKSNTIIVRIVKRAKIPNKA